MGACEKATKYACRIMASKTIDELCLISSEIRANLNELDGWVPWLRDIYKSQNKTLLSPETDMEPFLNQEGIEALRGKND